MKVRPELTKETTKALHGTPTVLLQLKLTQGPTNTLTTAPTSPHHLTTPTSPHQLTTPASATTKQPQLQHQPEINQVAEWLKQSNSKNSWVYQTNCCKN